MARAEGYESVSFAASVDTQRVKHSAQGYLGKYMSKGAGQIAKIVEEDAAIVDFLPSSWWHCSLNLRRAIGKRITGGNSTAVLLSRDIAARDSRIDYARQVCIQLREGEDFPVAVIGRLSGEGRKKYCFWKPGGGKFDGKTADSVE